MFCGSFQIAYPWGYAAVGWQPHIKPRINKVYVPGVTVLFTVFLGGRDGEYYIKIRINRKNVKCSWLLKRSHEP